ncbi:Ras-related protein [Takifugu flavidus]|uniref:small monomeric GTPase n=1 Tax=Takifugu flavidus TaxID=433684 RepID=A0A5C6NRH0_9TELE|nr:Ras-related protein [Takifugu flavidus]
MPGFPEQPRNYQVSSGDEAEGARPRAGGAHRSDTESFSSSLRRGLIQEPGMDAGSKVISTGSLTDTIKLQTWLTEIHDYAQQDVVLMLLGNKAGHYGIADAAQERVVKREDGERLAKEFGVPFMETSARSGLNIDLAFTAVAKELKHRSLKDPSETFKLQEYVDKEMKSSGCCRA